MGSKFSISRFRKGVYVYNSLTGNSAQNIKHDDFWALAELSDMLVSYRHFKQLHISEKKLKEAIMKSIGGADVLSEEIDTTARNYFFEIKVATRFKKAGFSVTFENTPDIDISVENDTFHIECKRVQSQKSIRGNIEKALNQLKHSQKGPSYGIIAIDFTKTIYDQLIDAAEIPYSTKALVEEYKKKNRDEAQSLLAAKAHTSAKANFICSMPLSFSHN